LSGAYIVVEKHVLEAILKEVQALKELSGQKPSSMGRYPISAKQPQKPSQERV